MAVAKTKPFDMEDIDGTKPQRETWGYIERGGVYVGKVKEKAWTSGISLLLDCIGIGLREKGNGEG